MGRRKKGGPSQPEVWREVAEALGGSYEPGSWRRGQRVLARWEGWPLVVDTQTVSDGSSSQVFTRARAPFETVGELKITIYAGGVLSRLGKLLGMQDIVIGRRELDERFVFKSDSEAKLRSLMLSGRVRELLQAVDPSRVEVKKMERGWRKVVGPDGREVSVLASGLLTDGARLRRLAELCGTFVSELARIGVARPEPPRLEL